MTNTKNSQEIKEETENNLWPTIHMAAYSGNLEKLLDELNSGTDPNKTEKLLSNGALTSKYNPLKFDKKFQV